MSQRVYDDAGNEYESFEEYAEAKAAAHQAKLAREDTYQRIERSIDNVEDVYQEAKAWHEHRLSGIDDGADPRTGFMKLKYIPHDENSDGLAKLHGVGTVNECNLDQDDSDTQPMQQEGGGKCAIAMMCVALIIVLLWMVFR